MPLPIIPNPNPITTPAVAEINYNSRYVVGLNITTQDAAGYVMPITVTYRPYDYDGKNLYPDGSHDSQFTIENIWPLAGQYPLVAQVVGGLISVIPVIEQILNLKNAVTAPKSLIEGIQNDIATIDAQIALGGDVTQYEQQKAILEARFAELQAQVAAAQAACAAQLPALEAALGA